MLVGGGSFLPAPAQGLVHEEPELAAVQQVLCVLCECAGALPDVQRDARRKAARNKRLLWIADQELLIKVCRMP